MRTTCPSNCRIESGLELNQTRPISGGRTVPLSTSIGRDSSDGTFEIFADEACAMFAEIAIFGGESRGRVAIDVEFANDFAANEDGDDNFGLGFDGAG